MSRLLRLLGPSSLLLAACNNPAGTSVLIIPATAIAVDPAAFLGHVACVDAPGAMQSYVATLYAAAGTPSTGIVRGPALMTSAPTPCFRSVLFQNVVLGQQYVASVDGYVYPANELTPKEPGSAVLLRTSDAGVSAEVAPRWQTNCGMPVLVASRDGALPRDAGLSGDGGLTDASVTSPRDAGAVPGNVGPTTVTADFVDASCATPYLLHPLPDGATPTLDGPACAVSEATVVLACTPLLAVNLSATGVTVNVGSALGSCGTSAGTVDTVAVRVRGTSGDGPPTPGPCAGAISFSGLEPGRAYTFDVSGTTVAADAGPTVVTTTCYATTIAGVAVAATCDPFVTH